eukprot:6191140-Pleurochrysis_carterae.AAC.1
MTRRVACTELRGMHGSAPCAAHGVGCTAKALRFSVHSVLLTALVDRFYVDEFLMLTAAKNRMPRWLKELAPFFNMLLLGRASHRMHRLHSQPSDDSKSVTRKTGGPPDHRHASSRLKTRDFLWSHRWHFCQHGAYL